jgi:DNA-binding NtrC family response regulator
MKKKRMLIIDDEENIRNALRRTFRKDNFDIKTADGAETAYELIRQHEFDVIICDHKMPKIAGADFLSSMRKNFPKALRIMLSGQADLDATIKLINDKSADRFISKPWDDDELRAIVNVALIERESRDKANRQKEAVEKTDNNQVELLRLELDYPGIADIILDGEGAIIID